MALLRTRAQPSAEALGFEESDLLDLVSHELSGRLMSVLGFSARLRKGVESGRVEVDDETRECIDMLHDEALRMQAVTSLFVDLARTEGAAPATAPTQLRRLVEAEVAVLRRGRPDVRVTLVTGGRTRPLIVDTDERCVRQVLVNLLDNAVKYGGDPPEVSVRILCAPGGVTISVRDNGDGVPIREQARIFGRLYRSPGTTTAGTGLGLYIARRLVDHLGGRLTVRNTRAGGAEFRFWLPAPDDEPRALPW